MGGRQLRDADAGHQCTFLGFFFFVVVVIFLFSSPSCPCDSMGRRLEESVSSTFYFTESPV